MNQLLIQYSYLQLLDLLTTVVFLFHGIKEGNPLVRFALSYAPNPLTGLLLIKLAAVGLGIYCWRLDKRRLLSRINIMFALVVAWNLSALIVAAI